MPIQQNARLRPPLPLTMLSLGPKASADPLRPISLPEGPSSDLRRALAATKLLCLEFVHVAPCDANLPAFKGDLWRSVLGMSLHAASPEAYEAVFRDHDLPPGRPPARWALQAPLLQQVRVNQGDSLRSKVTLFGPAVDFAPDFVKAMEAFKQWGVGRQGQRLALQLQSVQAITPAGYQPLDSASATVCALDVFDAGLADAAALGPRAPLQVAFLSPIELKIDNRQVRGAPTFDVLMRRIFSRVVSVAPTLDGGLFARGEDLAWHNWSSGIATLKDATVAAGPGRHYSATQGREHPLLGTGGVVEYAPPACLALPWLRLAEWMQLGKKTHYGFGVLVATPGQAQHR